MSVVQSFGIKELNEICKNTLISNLGIEFLGWADKQLKGTMPVDNRTIQPMGILHGGAMLTLSETLGSVASMLLVSDNTYDIFGMSIASNHLKAVKNGLITGVTHLIHEGSRTHVWDIKLYDEQNTIVHISRLTNMVVKK